MIYLTTKKNKHNIVYELIGNESHNEFKYQDSHQTIFSKNEFGEILNDLLNFNFDAFNDYIRHNIKPFFPKPWLRPRDSIEDFLTEYNPYQTLSKSTQNLLFYTCDLFSYISRLVRIKEFDLEISYDLFTNIKQCLELVHTSIHKGKNSNEYKRYFEFIFSYYFNFDIKNYTFAHDKNYLNHIVPLLYRYSISTDNADSLSINFDKFLDSIYSDQLTKYTLYDLILSLPENNLYRIAALFIFEMYFDTTDKNLSLQFYPRDQKSDILASFSEYPEIVDLYLESIYEYNYNRKEKFTRFDTIEEYFMLAVIACYNFGYSIKQCEICKKYFVCKVNSRKLCGNSKCKDEKDKKSGQTQTSNKINDKYILNQVNKNLCYSSGSRCDSKYEKTLNISFEKSKQLVDFLFENIYRALRVDNKDYKKKIKETNEYNARTSIYEQWLHTIKKTYKGGYVANQYNQSTDKCNIIFEYPIISDDFTSIKLITKKINFK